MTTRLEAPAPVQCAYAWHASGCYHTCHLEPGHEAEEHRCHCGRSRSLEPEEAK